jgi:hypothetical protein
MSGKTTRIFRIGAIGFAIGCGLIIFPLLLPPSSANKFLVALGFITLCWSLSCLLNALLDCWRERGKS